MLRIFGETFCFVTWNKNKGDLTPLYVEAKKVGAEDKVPNKFTGRCSI